MRFWAAERKAGTSHYAMASCAVNAALIDNTALEMINILRGIFAVSNISLPHELSMPFVLWLLALPASLIGIDWRQEAAFIIYFARTLDIFSTGNFDFYFGHLWKGRRYYGISWSIYRCLHCIKHIMPKRHTRWLALSSMSPALLRHRSSANFIHIWWLRWRIKQDIPASIPILLGHLLYVKILEARKTPIQADTIMSGTIELRLLNLLNCLLAVKRHEIFWVDEHTSEERRLIYFGRRLEYNFITEYRHFRLKSYHHGTLLSSTSEPADTAELLIDICWNMIIVKTGIYFRVMSYSSSFFMAWAWYHELYYAIH